MVLKREVYSKVTINGQIYNIKLINNPTIDDIVETEARIYAIGRKNGQVDENRYVKRSIKDFLIRVGVER